MIEAGDLRLAATLPFYAAIAWTIPERHWTALIRRGFAPIDMKGPLQAISRGIAVSGLEAKLAIDGQLIARELNANRLESYLQYLRDYRPGGWRGEFHVENEETLRQAARAGRGVILWVGHFVFNGLPLKKALHLAGYRVSHLSRPEHGFSSSRFAISVLNPLRSRIECRYLARRIIIERGGEHRAVREARRLLRDGGIVSITAGHWEGRQIAWAPIGQAELPLAVGAPGLAQAAGAALLPVFIVRDLARGGSSFRIVIGDRIECDGERDRDQAVRSAVADFARQLTPYVVSHPGQWRGWKYLVRAETPAVDGQVM
jgi:lauroyl/myristoyl acyltransferase